MIKVYGSMNCPDCTAFKKNLDTYAIPYEFVDINLNMPNLKAFLKLRDHNALYDAVKENGSVGIPTVQFEDGSLSLDWEKVIRDAGKEVIPSSGEACSLDHKGNC
jgi:glutaredoxin-related protein